VNYENELSTVWDDVFPSFTGCCFRKLLQLTVGNIHKGDVT